MTGPIKGAGEGFAAFSNRLPRVFLAPEVYVLGENIAAVHGKTGFRTYLFKVFCRTNLYRGVGSRICQADLAVCRGIILRQRRHRQHPCQQRQAQQAGQRFAPKLFQGNSSFFSSEGDNLFRAKVGNSVVVPQQRKAMAFLIRLLIAGDFPIQGVLYHTFLRGVSCSRIFFYRLRKKARTPYCVYPRCFYPL